MPTKSFYQFVGCVVWNLAAALPPPDRGPELDLRQRQYGESMPGVAGGEGEKSLCPRFIHVKLDQGTRFQVVERQFSTPLPQNRRGQRLAFDVDRMKI